MTRTTGYVRPGVLDLVGGLLLLVGLGLAVGGPAWAVNAATQAPAAVRVRVLLDPGSAQEQQLQDGRRLTPPPPGAEATTLTTSLAPVSGGPHADDDPLGPAAELSAWGSTRTEQFLSRGDWALGGLGAGLAALLLRPVLASLAAGRAFGAGNARRLARVALVVAVTAHLAPLLPALAAGQVLARLGLTGGALEVPQWLLVGPWTFGALGVLVLAEAFRQGERLHRDLDGLV